MGKYETFDHTADVGLIIRGRTLEDLFETAARAMFDQTLKDWPEELQMQDEVRAAVPQGLEGDWGELLIAWLQELLYRFSTGRWVPLRCDFESIGPREVRADVGFGRFDPQRHWAKREIKAVTYHDLQVRQEPDGEWSARFILDV
jgi:SHS2 domain-containing protein